ncbi:MAG: zf-HC2 domain-containing protein [Bacteroidota bacterium]
MKHVRTFLYDVATGALDSADRERVEAHLAGCVACRAELEEIRALLEVLPGPAASPEAQRDQAFWTAFANEVEAKLVAAERKRLRLTPALLDRISMFVSANRAPLLSGAGAVALIAAFVVLFWPKTPADVEQPAVALNPTPVSISEPAAQRMNDYIKRSKVLLIGLTNMNTAEGSPLDLSVERRQSRALVHEARYLRNQPLDARSAELVGDLEKILIELANLEEEHDLPNVELIRSGIRRENLLFKIRMAENLLESGVTERRPQ